MVEILPSGGQHVSFPALQTGLASSNVRTSLMDSSMWTRAAREHVTCAPGAETRSNACESPIQRGGIQIRPYAATPTVSHPSPLLVSSHLARTQVATILGTRQNRRLAAQVWRTACRSAASPPAEPASRFYTDVSAAGLSAATAWLSSTTLQGPTIELLPG